MAQTPKGRLVQGLYKPIHRTCAMYFYLGVNTNPMDPLGNIMLGFQEGIFDVMISLG